ncbi:MAG: FAD-dependent oxidoreductase [Austwickia sp.]|nr:FAD-dependent oxidoreductase [Austwickia sp.]MBK8437023.1 FAD-dependent oxidoreductase [Austwickia sp.]
MDADVVIVGAGLSGLRCAVRLEELGHQVVVVEAEQTVGGRLRTDLIDGFRTDHGFAVILPAYPALAACVDLDALDLRSFGAGVLVRRYNGLKVLADPAREPQWLLRSLRSGYLDPVQLAAAARWYAPVLTGVRRVLQSPDVTLGKSFDDAGFTGALRREVVDVFFAGVLGDSYGATSANYVRVLAKMFATSTPGLPAAGMVALAQQLADRITGAIRLGERVERLEDGAAATPEIAVHTTGGTLRARRVVVAGSPQSIPDLTGLPAPDTRGLITWWFEADEAPHPLPLLAVDGRRSDPTPPGPVWNAAVVSNAVPSYAPSGRHLVQATTVLDRPDGQAPEPDVRRHLAEIYGCPTRDWRVISRYEIPHALPFSPPPLTPRRPVDLGAGRFVCGDHRDTSSIQGALVSGQRTAAAVHASLR